MRVLFTVYPSLVHFWHAVPCAWALQSAGHEVRVATHAAFTGSIAAAGLTPVGLGDPREQEARIRTDARALAHPDEVLRYADALGLDDDEREHWIAYYQYLLNPVSDYLRTDLPYADALIDFTRAWQPDLIVWDPTFACAPVAARVTGAAHARLVFGPDYLVWSFDRLAERGAQLRAAGLSENPQGDLLRPLAQRYGLEVDDELLYGHFSLDMIPDGLALPVSGARVPMRLVPFTGAQEFPAWLHSRPQRPRVALTLGESTRRFVKGDWGRTPKILEAVAELDIELVATLNSLQLEGVERAPDNVRVIDFVPLAQLLPTCAAVIHHGGTGTFAAACAANIPQIVCDTGESLMIRQVQIDPRSLQDGAFRAGFEYGVSEQVVETITSWELPAKKLEATPTADYVLSRGAGERLDHQRQSAGEIRKMIEDVLFDERYRAGAQAVHDDWLALPSPAAIVGRLEQLTAEHRRR